MTDLCSARHGLETFLAKQLSPPGKSPGIDIEVLRGRGYLNLRGNSHSLQFVTAAEKSLGQSLPIQANTMSSGDLDVYWLGPDEWLVADSQTAIAKVVESHAMAVAPHTGTVTDLSGAYVEFTLSGESAADVIAKGCTLNIPAMRDRRENSAQCGLAKATVLLSMTNSEKRFGIIVRRSFAEYVAMWLEQAAKEFGIRFKGA